MKKLLKIFLIICAFCAVFSVSASADEVDKYIDMLSQSIPSDFEGYFNNLSEGELPSFKDIFGVLVSEIKNTLSRPVKILSSVIFCIIVSSVYHSFEGTLKNGRLGRAFDSVCNLGITLSLVNVSFSSVDMAYSFIAEVSNFSMSLFPILSGVSLLSGNLNEALVTGSGMILFVSICEKVMCEVLIPTVKIMSALCLCSSFDSFAVDLSGVVKFLKGFFSTVLGFCMMIFGSVLSYQTIVASAKDTIGVKTIKFTVGTAIPVVGASVAEALRTIGGALSLLKSTVGGVGVSVVLLLLLPCILCVTFDRLTLSAGAALSRLIGCKREAQLLEQLLSVYGFIIALLCVVSLMLVFILSVFASTASSLGG